MSLALRLDSHLDKRGMLAAALNAEGPAQLAGADLVGMDLSQQDLRDADLCGADLSGADLSGADLNRACLRGAVLDGATLKGAMLAYADLRDASLHNVQARDAVFGGADLTGAQLFEAVLSGAVLTGCCLRGVDLRATQLDGAQLRDADLRDANLGRANLQGADLVRAKVAGACFRAADLRHSRPRQLQGFRQANWIGVDLREVELNGAHLLRRHVIDENYLFEFRHQSRGHEWSYQLWRATSDCGRSLLRWVACLVAVVLAFATLYTAVEMDWGDHPTALSPVYFSIVTLTTLGYGDALPASAMAQALVSAEVVVGYIGLGGLLAIVSNKMARRGE